jgi:hypothetical protein
MKDNKKPGTAVESQGQAAFPTNIKEAKRDIDIIIDGDIKKKKEPHPGILRLNRLGVAACKIAKSMKADNEIEAKRASVHISYLKNIQEEMEAIFEVPRAFFLSVRDHVLKRRNEFTAGLIEGQETLKAEIAVKATNRAVAKQKKNDEAIARAADETSEKKDDLNTRADMWEGKGKPEKAAQLREEAEVTEVAPNITVEDLKNWTFDTTVTKKRAFLIYLSNDPNSDLTGVTFSKTMLNQIGKRINQDRPQKFTNTDWGHIRGTKKR